VSGTVGESLGLSVYLVRSVTEISISVTAMEEGRGYT